MKRSATVAAKLSRGALLLTGLAILLWSGLEDSDAAAVTALGGLSAISLTLLLMARLSAGRRVKSGHTALAGALAGALASLCAAALMLFKNLRHAHIFPDYPAEMLLAVLERLPIWTIAGSLAGLGIGLLLAPRRRDSDRRAIASKQASPATSKTKLKFNHRGHREQREMRLIRDFAAFCRKIF